MVNNNINKLINNVPYPDKFIFEVDRIFPAQVINKKRNTFTFTRSMDPTLSRLVI